MKTMANLHNIKTDRYHPIMFEERPTPSHQEGDSLMRSKSLGHHTEGFDTREEALNECQTLASQHGMNLCIEKDFPWDGECTPAMVTYFSEADKDGNVTPVL